MIDEMAQAERETARWLILLAVYHSSPNPCGEPLLLRLLRGQGIAFSGQDLRHELDYLQRRGLVAFERGDHMPVWMVEITRAGADLAEYTVPCDPGIARPPRS